MMNERNRFKPSEMHSEHIEQEDGDNEIGSPAQFVNRLLPKNIFMMNERNRFKPSEDPWPFFRRIFVIQALAPASVKTTSSRVPDKSLNPHATHPQTSTGLFQDLSRPLLDSEIVTPAPHTNPRLLSPQSNSDQSPNEVAEMFSNYLSMMSQEADGPDTTTGEGPSQDVDYANLFNPPADLFDLPADLFDPTADLFDPPKAWEDRALRTQTALQNHGVDVPTQPLKHVTRKNLTPESLGPLDVPTHPHKYATPSATSRKDSPVVFARMRARSQAFGDDDDEGCDEAQLPLNASEREQIEWKRRQNTIAARKSRKRKLQLQLELEAAVESEKSERETWKVGR